MKSLWKWSAVVVAVALLVVWGSQAQDWKIESVASGPDAAKQRVLEPDVAVDENGVVYVSYIDQKENAVMLLQLKDDSKALTALKRDTGRVAGTSVAVGGGLVCVSWEELGDASGVHEIWQACWEKPLDNDEAPKDVWRWSTEGVIAGQANGAGWGEFGLNFDDTFAPDGTLYAIWAEDYAKLKAGKYKGGAQSACGDFPPIDIPEAPIRYPTIYVDSTGRVWAGSADISYPPGPDIWVWYSDDQCATWTKSVNISAIVGGKYSDGVGIVRLGDKIYAAYDDDVVADPGTADVVVTICSVDLQNCQRTIALRKGGFPHIATDGKGLYVTANNEEVLFGYSCDAGATWTAANIPNKYNLGFRDPDFGAALSRFRVATSAGSPNVYVTWLWRTGGRSNIMLASRPKPCQ